MRQSLIDLFLDIPIAVILTNASFIFSSFYPSEEEIAEYFNPEKLHYAPYKQQQFA